MAPSTRDRLSVDLRGLKPALLARAEATGVSPSTWVRRTMAEALGRPRVAEDRVANPLPVRAPGGRVRLTLRMSRARAASTLQAARAAGQAPGDYVADLVAGVPAVSSPGHRAEHIAALVASCAELSSLSRNLHHLTTLLRQGAHRPAAEYRPMLASLHEDVRRHLDLATRVLAELRPRRTVHPGRAGRSASGREPRP